MEAAAAPPHFMECPQHNPTLGGRERGASKDTLRTSLCFRRAGRLHRLVWFNESGGGIYFGFLGGLQENHHSYHADGTRHLKMGGQYVPHGKDVPLVDVRGVLQLGHASLSLSETWFSDSTAYAGDNQTETVVVIDDGHFEEGGRCGLDVWLLDRASEAELYARLAAQASAVQDSKVIADVVSSLDSYRGHKIALTVRAVKAWS
jgi:hypothetical protein